jgi:hypothetical protein
MPRKVERKNALSLESLEDRNLLSALGAGANEAAANAVAPGPALISAMPAQHTALQSSVSNGSGGGGGAPAALSDIHAAGTQPHTGGGGAGAGAPTVLSAIHAAGTRPFSGGGGAGVVQAIATAGSFYQTGGSGH